MRDRGFIKRGARQGINVPGILLRADGSELSVTVEDISASGFRLHVLETPTIGEEVSLKVPGYEAFAAKIRWALGHAAGGQFLIPAKVQDECSD